VIKLLLLLIFAAFPVFSFGQKVGTTHVDKIFDVSLCDLLTNPQEFADKLVRVKATYRYGFEWSDLYCSDCESPGDVWVDFTEGFEGESKKKYRKKLNENGEVGRTVNVIFVGKFYSGGHYGHMSGYPYKFIAQRVENAKIIYKDSPSPEFLPNEVKTQTYCQKKP
jgi:hypothetical protein